MKNLNALVKEVSASLGYPFPPEGDDVYDTEDFDLDAIPPSLHAQALKYARRGEPDGIYGCADSNNSLLIFHQNSDWFESHDLYEKALLTAWVNQKNVPPSFQPFIKRALRRADRKMLRRHSDPLPEGDEFTVYRGVQKGVPRGISWTLDVDVARRFASWWGEAGTVYKTIVKRSDVYAYVSDVTGRCGEKEVLLVLDDDHPIEMFEQIEERE